MTEQEVTALRLKITGLETSYEKLISGLLPRVITDQNGERVEFTAGNRAALYLYILQLKAQLPEATTRASRPLGYYF